MSKELQGVEGSAVATSSQWSGILDHFLKGLNWTYDRALVGVTGTAGAVNLAEEYLERAKTPEAAINSLVKWQITKASATGFVTNLGGLITLPVAIPADLLGTVYFQTEMIAAIAHIRGHDVHSNTVRTMALTCLAGNSAFEVLKGAGIAVTTRLTANAIGKIKGATLIRINQAVGMRLLTKAGTTGVLNLSKIVPVVGGVVGGAIDGVTTRVIAGVAKRVFEPVEKPALAEQTDV